MCFVLNIFVFYMCLQASHSDQIYEKCEPVNNEKFGKIWAKVQNINSKQLHGDCYIKKEDNSDYTIEWLFGNEQVGYCATISSNKLNYECKIDIAAPKKPGTLTCRASKKLSDNTIGYCSKNVGLIIDNKDWLQYTFDGEKKMKVWMEYISGQPPTCYIKILPKDDMSLKVDWYLDNVVIGSCTEKDLTSLGDYKRCKFKGEILQYTGTLYCMLIGNIGTSTGQGKSNAVHLMSNGKKLKDGPTPIGNMTWVDMTKQNVTGGQEGNVWCHIDNLSPGYNYSISWYLRQHDSKKVLKRCVLKEDERHLTCGFHEQFELYAEGEFYCSVMITKKALIISTKESDCLYNVKSHPRIEVRNFANKSVQPINGNEYFEADCSVLKYDRYTLRWILPNSREADPEDYEDKSNSSHNRIILRTKFDVNTDNGKDLMCIFRDSNNNDVDNFWIILNITEAGDSKVDNTTTENITTVADDKNNNLIDDIGEGHYTNTIESSTSIKPTSAVTEPTTISTIHNTSSTPNATATQIRKHKALTSKPISRNPPKPSASTSTPKPSTPMPPTPKPTNPKPTKPKPTKPKPTPKPTTLKLIPPKPTAPEPSTPVQTTPEPTTPKATAKTTDNNGYEKYLVTSIQNDNRGHCALSCIVTIIGILVTVVANSIVFGVYCARKKACCKRDPTKQREFEARPGANTTYSDERGDEPSYSVPHKWLSRPSKKLPTVSYTALDLLPTSTGLRQREETTHYAEIVGVEKPEYGEVNIPGIGPEYSNLKHGIANQPVYSNTAEVNNLNMAEYADVLPKHRR